jgi:transcriptional antiterminator NusG
VVQNRLAESVCRRAVDYLDIHFFGLVRAVSILYRQHYVNNSGLDFLRETQMENGMRWYMINVQTGLENRVAGMIREKIDAAKLNPLFGEILVPEREVVEMKKGKREKSMKKFFPGYVVIQMEMTNETFTLVKQTPNVIMFLGQKNKPIPITEAEAQRLRHQMEQTESVDDTNYEVGQEVRVIDGPFANFNGVVSEADNARQKLTAVIAVFGRETSVNLDFSQVEKA